MQPQQIVQIEQHLIQITKGILSESLGLAEATKQSTLALRIAQLLNIFNNPVNNEPKKNEEIKTEETSKDTEASTVKCEEKHNKKLGRPKNR